MNIILCTIITKQILRDDDRLLLLFWHPLINHTSQYFCLCAAPYHIVSELDHVITFVQWDITKHDVSEGPISTCTLKSGHSFLEPSYHAGRKPKQPRGEAHV